PLVVRAGAGSPRDTLSILDQLIAGSEGASVSYERAVALLGYTHGELLDEVVGAFAAGTPAGAFAAVDRVVQTGQDPRRFVEDLLERLRDLIVIAATGDQAASVLRGLPADELERMSGQAAAYGVARLSKAADIVSTALDGMVGATSPRLQLELMIARVLTADGAVASGSAPGAASSAPAASSSSAPAAAPSSAPAAAPVAAAPAVAAPAHVAAPVAPPVAAPVAPPVGAPPVAAPSVAPPVAAPSVAPATAPPAAAPAVDPETQVPKTAAPNGNDRSATAPAVAPSRVPAPSGSPESDEVPGAAWATATPGQGGAAASAEP